MFRPARKKILSAPAGAGMAGVKPATDKGQRDAGH